MKKIISIILSLCTVVLSVSVSAYSVKNTPFTGELHTNSIYLVNQNSNEILFSKNCDEVRSMGSTAKIMNFIIVVENIRDLKNTRVKIDKELWKDLDPDASDAGLWKYNGEYMSVLDLLYGLMLPSGCDAAMVLADFVGGNIQNFVKLMNEKAKALGCVNTNYVDPHGLSDNDLTTAKELYKIFDYALKKTIFREIISKPYYYYENDSKNPICTTDYLLETDESGMYYYPYCMGGKTGYITSAGKCLATVAKKGDTEMACIALGGLYSDEYNYMNFAMVDSAALYNWAFEKFTSNVDVLFDRRFLSLQLGEKKQIKYSVDKNGLKISDKLQWESSDKSIVTVDGNGVVTARKIGTAKITATTKTGNKAEIYVSVGFYNGLTVTSRNGSFADGKFNDADWEKVKQSGVDYCLVRAGWTFEEDGSFEKNINGALNSSIPCGIIYVTYADSSDEAKGDAEYIDRLIDKRVGERKSDITLPVVYDLVTGSFGEKTASQMVEFINIFKENMEKEGYDIILNADSSIMEKLYSQQKFDRKIPIMLTYHQNIVDCSEIPALEDGSLPVMWDYTNMGYVPGAVHNSIFGTYRNLMYMASAKASLFSIDLFSKAKSGNETVLTWEKKSNCKTEPDGYRIYRSSMLKNKVLLDTVSAETFSYTDKTNVAGIYTYTVEPVFKDVFDTEYENLLSAEKRGVITFNGLNFIDFIKIIMTYIIKGITK